MKTIINLLNECENSLEVIACLVSIVLGYIFIAALFWNFHWMCGIMSFYLTTSLIKASVFLVKYIEAHGAENNNKANE